MMRRGIWQQKQRRPSACLLCRFTHSYGPYTRPVLRPTSSLDGTAPSPDSRPPTILPTCEYWARSYSATAHPGRHDGLGGPGSGPRHPSSGALTYLGKGPSLQRAFSTNGLPSWATAPGQPGTGNAGPSWVTQKPQPAASNDVLLPHERAAREKTMSRNPTPPATPAQSAQPAATRERLSRHEPATHRRRPRDARPPPAPSAEGEQPGWAVRRVTADGPRHQNYGPGSSATAAQLRQGSPPKEGGHAGIGAGMSRRAPTPRHDFRRAGSALTQTSADEGEWKNLARRDRNLPPGPSSSLPMDSLPIDRDLPPGFSSFPPPARDLPPAFGSFPSRGRDLPPGFSSFAPQGRDLPPGFSAFSPPARDLPSSSNGAPPPTVGADPWKLMENSAADVKRAEKKKTIPAPDADPWSWTKEYAVAPRRETTQWDTRETRQDVEPAAGGAGPGASSSRHTERYERSGNADRFDRSAREERGEKRGKKNKAKPQRRQGREDEDNWDDDFYEEKRRRKAMKAERERQRQAALDAADPTPIFLPEYISVSNLATALGQKVDVFVRQLEELGFEDVSKENILTGETAALVAQEYGFEPTVDAGEDEDLKPAPPPADPSSLPLRPPVVTIMGHVDHGKTTLLDYLRKSSIVAQEHGGITQHIGAFSVSLSTGKQITFLDTPGHAAFLSMRQRGANVTDMVILVVAADDSVMPQTLEALKHARAAKVPIIVAINKVDKPEANVERVKSDLATHGVEIEDYGGDVQVVCVSGKTGQGMDDLEENILLLSEMLDIRAEPDGMAEGWVLESTIKPIGRVATVLVKRGTLRPGDSIVAGRVHARIRSLRNEAGVEVDEAPPGTAIEVLGWKEPPEAGDQVLQAPDESKAKAAVRYRLELKERGEVIGQMAQQEQDRRERDRERALAEAANPRDNKRHHGRHAPPQPAEAAPETDETAPAPDPTKYLTFIVKGDVHGSVEAVSAALLEQGNNAIRARVLISAPGQITESEVEHAAVSGSTIINFNNPVPSHIRRLAEDAGVKILDHNVIYHLVEEVRDRLADALPPLVVKKVVGEAEVLQIFPINVRGRVYKNIAGCRIGNGYVKKGSKARVLRGGENIFEGTIETLKHVKKDVEEMKKGSECGMSFAQWDELKAGDHIQILEEVTERRKL